VKKYSKKEITQHCVVNHLSYSDYFLTIWCNIRSDNSNFRLTAEGYKLLVNNNVSFYSVPLNIKITLLNLTKLSKFIPCPFFVDLGKNKIHIVDNDLAIKLMLLEDVKSFLDLQDSVDNTDNLL
jgi:hypothetical protein